MKSILVSRRACCQVGLDFVLEVFRLVSVKLSMVPSPLVQLEFEKQVLLPSHARQLTFRFEFPSRQFIIGQLSFL